MSFYNDYYRYKLVPISELENAAIEHTIFEGAPTAKLKEVKITFFVEVSLDEAIEEIASKFNIQPANLQEFRDFLQENFYVKAETGVGITEEGVKPCWTLGMQVGNIGGEIGSEGTKYNLTIDGAKVTIDDKGLWGGSVEVDVGVVEVGGGVEQTGEGGIIINGVVGAQSGIVGGQLGLEFITNPNGVTELSTSAELGVGVDGLKAGMRVAFDFERIEYVAPSEALINEILAEWYNWTMEDYIVAMQLDIGKGEYTEAVLDYAVQYRTTVEGASTQLNIYLNDLSLAGEKFDLSSYREFANLHNDYPTALVLLAEDIQALGFEVPGLEDFYGHMNSELGAIKIQTESFDSNGNILDTQTLIEHFGTESILSQLTSEDIAQAGLEIKILGQTVEDKVYEINNQEGWNIDINNMDWKYGEDTVEGLPQVNYFTVDGTSQEFTLITNVGSEDTIDISAFQDAAVHVRYDEIKNQAGEVIGKSVNIGIVTETGVEKLIRVEDVPSLVTINRGNGNYITVENGNIQIIDGIQTQLELIEGREYTVEEYINEHRLGDFLLINDDDYVIFPEGGSGEGVPTEVQLRELLDSFQLKTVEELMQAA